ncbi:MAG: hypothetical protein GY866_30810 [Proteobacteria bacterium]|nr:hypothetical protein [Pseudomonadota bacterium]
MGASNQQLSALNNELQAQSSELQAQAGELEAQKHELEAQQIQVEEADRLKSEFLSNMSHVLRTPLNSVLALSQLMISSGTGKDPNKDAGFLKVIERNGKRLLNLINDILDLSKIEAGKTELNLSEVTVELLAKRILDTLRPLSDEKGEVELRVKRSGYAVSFSVRDTGKCGKTPQLDFSAFRELFPEVEKVGPIFGTDFEMFNRGGTKQGDRIKLPSMPPLLPFQRKRESRCPFKNRQFDLWIPALWRE